ncbi:hypothetical protein KUV57_12355 [Epibacterium sp. DP7N7-1]|nr:hypothetical protein [Epibacterium sp. DP7N7-1]
MTAENTISSLMSHACSAVCGWMEEYPRAPLIRKLRIIVDQDVTIAIPGDPEGLHRGFFDEKIGMAKSQERLAALAKELREALPAGAFPFQIDFGANLRVGNGRAYVDPEFVKLSAAGVNMESTTGWRHPFQRFEDKLSLLNDLAPETMEKTEWFVVRTVDENEPKPGPVKIHASSDMAARFKAMMVANPSAAHKVMIGQPHSLHECDLALLGRFHVAPAGRPLIDMARDLEPVPEPG